MRAYEGACPAIRWRAFAELGSWLMTARTRARPTGAPSVFERRGVKLLAHSPINVFACCGSSATRGARIRTWRIATIPRRNVARQMPPHSERALNDTWYARETSVETFAILDTIRGSRGGRDDATRLQVITNSMERGGARPRRKYVHVCRCRTTSGGTVPAGTRYGVLDKIRINCVLCGAAHTLSVGARRRDEILAIRRPLPSYCSCFSPFRSVQFKLDNRISRDMRTNADYQAGNILERHECPFAVRERKSEREREVDLVIRECNSD